ncbi:MAG: 3-keto-disaccharide hydrolase [Bryobacteraceae bacterium]
MKRLLLATLCFALSAGGEEGWQPLFNGMNLDEWVVDTPGIWTVENGVITGRSQGLKYNDFLRTKKEYGNFALRLSFRLKDGIGNSGIQFRSEPVPNSHEVSGYQADIGEKYWGCLYDESRRNKVLAGPDPDQLTGLNKKDWNQYVITAKGGHITLELNGIKTVDYQEPNPGIAKRGLIALQVHSGPPLQVEFKDLEIRELD